jgi:hypothetical protein
MAVFDGDVVALLSLKDGVFRRAFTLNRPSLAIYQVSFHRTKPLLAVSSQDGAVNLFDFQSGKRLWEFRGYRDSDWSSRTSSGTWRRAPGSPRAER